MQYSKNYKGRVDAVEEKGTNTDSEERYRCLFEQATDLIVIHDMGGGIVNANDSLFSRLGYTRDEMTAHEYGRSDRSRAIEDRLRCG